MDGFMHLRRAGILKREIFDLDESVRCYLHGAFFLGSNEFYQWLRDLHERGESGLCMTRVSKVNDLYDPNELALRQQRVKARFFNTGMNATLLGGMASDTLENGQVVSGVGGQYNFVAMSHELPDSLSVLMLRSVHGPRSNFVWGQDHLTIPRHLRDVVISEFGIAFLKNRTDQEVIQAQLCLTDHRFQAALQEQAVSFGKLRADWKMPEWTANNHPDWPSQFLHASKAQGLFPAFPFGSDFTPVEERLVLALGQLQSATHSKSKMLEILWRGWRRERASYREPLERMQLWQPRSWMERIYSALLVGVL
jgi:acyl-CoA hydrolase